MPGKTITDEFRAWLQGEQVDMALCLYLKPVGYDPMGFTTWDSDVSFGGLTYEFTNAVSASALRADIGNGIDNMELSGLLQSDSITAQDIAAGKYDTAKMVLYAVCPTNTTMGQMVLVSGLLGQFKTLDNSYVVELRSLMQRMSQQIGELLSPGCRVFVLGDYRCKFDLDGDTVGGVPARSTGTVTAVLGEVGLRLSGIVTTGGYYTDGTIRFTTGANSGIEREIQVHGDPAATANVNIVTSVGGVGYNGDPGSGGSDFGMSLPAGDWVSGYVTVEATWFKKSTDGGDDTILLELPSGDQYTVASATSDGNSSYNVELSPSTMAAINTITGVGTGPIAGKVKHSGDTNAYDLTVTQLVLTLFGTPASTTDLIVLCEEFPYGVESGDQAVVTVGCNRLISTCQNRFGNTNNFRGEPWVPGVDHILKVGRN